MSEPWNGYVPGGITITSINQVPQTLFEAAWRIIVATLQSEGWIDGTDADLDMVITHARNLGLPDADEVHTSEEAAENRRANEEERADRLRLRREIEKDWHIPPEVLKHLATLSPDERVKWWDKHSAEWGENPAAVLAAAERN